MGTATKPKAIRPSKIAKVGDIILWNKYGLQMEVTMVRENSVIARFLEFPVKGMEDKFDWDKTVINHHNYQILISSKDK